MLRFIICAGLIALRVPFAYADIGAMDPVPAATLLLPYFEVDIEESSYPWAQFPTTRMSVRNTAMSETICHFVFYSDQAAPTVAFDVILRGYGSEEIDLRDIFVDNALNLGVDTVVSPAPPPYAIPALFTDGFESGELSGSSSSDARISLETLQAYHRGESSPRTGLCAGAYYGDGLCRGYITIDSAAEEQAGFPNESGYFAMGGLGRVNNDNVLTGEYQIINPPHNYCHGNPLVHIEASDDDPLVTTAGNYTFYARYVNAKADDNREPLGTRWGARYYTGGPFDGGTLLYYWRDPKSVDAPRACGTNPVWFPLDTAAILVYNEAGNLYAPPGVFPFPLACGRVLVGSTNLPSVFDFGSLRADFNDDRHRERRGADRRSRHGYQSIRQLFGRRRSGRGADLHDYEQYKSHVIQRHND